MKKLAKLITDEIERKTFPKNISGNKTIECKKFPTLIKKVENCKPFVGISILFLCVSLVFARIIVYFYLKLKNNILPYSIFFICIYNNANYKKVKY